MRHGHHQKPALFRCRLPRRCWTIENASQRDVVVNIARSWARTAEIIDRRVCAERGNTIPDLRNKLN